MRDDNIFHIHHQFKFIKLAKIGRVTINPSFLNFYGNTYYPILISNLKALTYPYRVLYKNTAGFRPKQYQSSSLGLKSSLQVP
jgi:hypothetical protein